MNCPGLRVEFAPGSMNASNFGFQPVYTNRLTTKPRRPRYCRTAARQHLNNLTLRASNLVSFRGSRTASA
jgi:hypothetical protein